MRRRYIAALIMLVALVLRVGQVERSSYTPINDGGSYLTLASEIAHHGTYYGNRGAGSSRGPTAYFPPAYPYFLAVVDLVDGHTGRRDGAIQPARIAQVVLGTITVGLIGLVALELFGPAVGLVALAAAAIYPPLIEDSTVLVAEGLLVVFELLAVWAALRARRSDRSLGWCAGAGLATGLAALTHENGILLVLPLGFALWTLGRNWRAPAVLLAATLVTIAPWMIRNAVVMDHFVPISDETGVTLAGTYNPTSAADRAVPYKWRPFEEVPSDRSIVRSAAHLTEPALGDRLLDKSLRYIGHHPLSPVAVAFDNTLRMFELEGSFAWEASAAAVSLDRGIARLGVIGLWIVTLLALAGLFTAPVRAAPRWLWAVPLLFWLSVALVNVETPRFRAPIDPFLILLAACALHALAERPALARLGRRAPVGHRLEPAPPAEGAERVEVVKRPA